MWFNFSESSLDLFFRRIRIVATAITEIATRETTTISKTNCISEDDDYLNFFNPPIIIPLGTPLEFPHVTCPIIYKIVLIHACQWLNREYTFFVIGS